MTDLPKVLVIDIGGFTVDYMILRYGRLEKEHVDSLESGVICLYGRIRAAIRQKYSIALDEEDIDNIILGKNTGYMQELKERVREVTNASKGSILLLMILRQMLKDTNCSFR